MGNRALAEYFDETIGIFTCLRWATISAGTFSLSLGIGFSIIVPISTFSTGNTQERSSNFQLS
jgi:hypothetical protein